VVSCITLINLDVMNTSFFKYVIEVHWTIVDPDAVVAWCHCIVCNPFFRHVLFNEDDFEWVKCWMYINHVTNIIARFYQCVNLFSVVFLQHTWVSFQLYRLNAIWDNLNNLRMYVLILYLPTIQNLRADVIDCLD
jgi:hypothetical protein